MMDQEVVTAAVAMEARVEAVVVHISVRYGRRLSFVMVNFFIPVMGGDP